MLNGEVVRCPEFVFSFGSRFICASFVACEGGFGRV